MKRSADILIHLFFWIAFLALTWMLTQVYLQAVPGAPFSRYLGYVIFLELFMGLLFFYLTFYGIKWAGKKPLRITALVLSLLFLLVFFAIPAVRVDTTAVLSSVIPHIILVFLAVVFRKYSDARHSEEEKKELLFQKTQAELSLLRMQLSPHFLFNTLNNIDFLIRQDVAKASDSISRLGALLRYMLYDAEADKIPLEKELNHMEDYIGLLRLRVNNAGYLKYSPPMLHGNYLIAPMLFLPLVENAYKHAPVREGEEIITIDLTVDEGQLRFRIVNLCSGETENLTSRNGIGLANVKRRLELIYPRKHSFRFSKEGNRFIVELTLEPDEDNLSRS